MKIDKGNVHQIRRAPLPLAGIYHGGFSTPFFQNNFVKEHLDWFLITPHSEITLTVQPWLPFKGDHVFMTTFIDVHLKHLEVVQLSVEMCCLLETPMPGEAFKVCCENCGEIRRIDFPTCEVNQRIMVMLSNKSDVNIQLKMWIDGIYAVL